MNTTMQAAYPASTRSQWPRLLCALPAQTVRDCAARLAATLQVHDVMLPQSGLGLLQMRESTRSEPYYIGEIPLSRAHVRVTNQQGQVTEGAAQLMDDRLSLARAIAILDAIKSAEWAGSDEIDALLSAGTERCRQVAQERGAMLARTQVSFSLLESAEEEEEQHV